MSAGIPVLSKTLQGTLSRNADTELGKRWNFAAIQSVNDFRRNVPLTDYEFYRPYIQRMMENGEKDLITCGEVVFYAPTSGTTSSSKFIPKYAHFKAEDAAPDRTLLFANILGSKQTELGVPITPTSASHLNALLSAEPYTYPIPSKAYLVADLTEALYVQMLFALKMMAPATASVISSIFISTLLTALNILTCEWQQMVKDIRQGRLKPSLKLSHEERESLEEAMGGPNPVKASELQSIFESASATKFKELVPQLWPGVDLVSAICGGEFSHYIPRLQYFLGEAIPLFSSMYVSSEGLLGVNKWPRKRTSAYALIPNTMFYEFIPLDEAESLNPEVLLMNEVTEGERYEIVITTGEGLYRYRLGDIITVLERTPEGPVIDVVGRKKMGINLSGCKLHAFEVADAVIALINKYSMGIDYLMSADTSLILPRYVVWLECDSGDLNITTTEAIAIIEGHLMSCNTAYKRSFEWGTVDHPIAVKLLKPGTIQDAKSSLKQRSAVGETQMKLSRVVSDPELLDLLERSIIAK